MSADRDIQSNLAVHEESIVIDSKTTFYSVAGDMRGFRAVMCALSLSRVLVPANEETRIFAEDSPDGITWTAVAFYKQLPSRNASVLGELLINGQDGWMQTVGIVSIQRYVRVGFQAVVYSAPLTIRMIGIMEPELKDFTAYDPGVPSDLRP